MLKTSSSTFSLKIVEGIVHNHSCIIYIIIPTIGQHSDITTLIIYSFISVGEQSKDLSLANYALIRLVEFIF